MYRNNARRSNRINQNFVLSAYEDSHGVLWVGNDSVLNAIDAKRGEVTQYRHNPADPSSISDGTVLSVIEEPSGTLWFGTYRAGLNRFDRGSGKFKSYRHRSTDPNSISSDVIFRMFLDHRGRFWIATNEGLDRFDPNSGHFKHYSRGSGNSRAFAAIAEDQQGVLWLGTYDDGAYRFDPETGQFQAYRYDPNTRGSLSSNHVNAIHIDTSGTVWIGTQRGLNRLSGGNSFTAYFQSDGLPDSDIRGILEDAGGNLWISTNNGLSRFNPSEKTFRNYNVWDGLAGNEFNSWGTPFKSDRGKLFFPGVEGLTAFFPDKVVDNSYIPPVVLTDFRLFNETVPVGQHSPLKKSISYTDALELSHKQAVVSFEFSALSYIVPVANRYRYKLEGLETQWNDVSSAHRYATYTTLPAGEYVFRVQGSNNRGLWNEQGASLRIRILPPWWSTWWFRTIIGASAVLSLWCVYYLRVRAFERRQAWSEQHQTEIRALNEQLIKAQEAERMRISGDLHDDVLQQITSLTLRLGQVRRQVPPDSQAKATVNVLQQELIQIGTHIRHISHELHPALLQESGLPVALSSYCEEFSKVRGLPVSCEPDESVEELSPGAALCLYRVAQEALGNAAKYSQAKKVEVRLTRADGRVRLSVSDDGVGCDPNQTVKSGGLGVINMRERVLQLHGTFEFDSAPGRGTTVKAEVPFRPAS